MSIGENIKRLRKEKGLTQKRLGELCNPPMDEANVRRYETDRLTPKFETVKKIAAALDVTPYYLMGNAYFDELYPNAGNEVKEYDAFTSYLKSLGYILQSAPVSENGEKATFTLTKDGKNATFTQEEFKELQGKTNNAAQEVIDARFYKKLLQQK